jgi:hypothetical protein
MHNSFESYKRPCPKAKLQGTNMLKVLIYLTWCNDATYTDEARRKLSSSFRTYLETSTTDKIEAATQSPLS